MKDKHTFGFARASSHIGMQQSSDHAQLSPLILPCIIAAAVFAIVWGIVSYFLL